MTYDPYREHDPRAQYPPPHYQAPYQQDQYPPQHGGYDPHARRRREDRANTVANIIHVVVGIILIVFALHVVFVLLDANQGNEFVSFVYTLAKAFVLGLGDVFTPDDATLGVVMNYGLAALVYLVLSQLVINALRRR
jgi:hypothetical protein